MSAKVISANEPGEIGLAAEVIDDARLHVATESQVTQDASPFTGLCDHERDHRGQDRAASDSLVNR